MVLAVRSAITNTQESARSVNGSLQAVSQDVVRDSTTNTTATSAVTTWTTPTVDLGAAYANQRTLVLGQWVQDASTTVPTGITMEVQWSDDGTNWYTAPTSAQGDARSSTITTSGQDRTIITRGQVLARYFRVQMVTTAAALGAGKIVVWHTRSV